MRACRVFDAEVFTALEYRVYRVVCARVRCGQREDKRSGSNPGNPTVPVDELRKSCKCHAAPLLTFFFLSIYHFSVSLSSAITITTVIYHFGSVSVRLFVRHKQKLRNFVRAIAFGLTHIMCYARIPFVNSFN